MPCGNICHFKTEQVFPQAIDSEKCSEIKKKKKNRFLLSSRTKRWLTFSMVQLNKGTDIQRAEQHIEESWACLC